MSDLAKIEQDIEELQATLSAITLDNKPLWLYSDDHDRIQEQLAQLHRQLAELIQEKPENTNDPESEDPGKEQVTILLSGAQSNSMRKEEDYPVVGETVTPSLLDKSEFETHHEGRRLDHSIIEKRRQFLKRLNDIPVEDLDAAIQDIDALLYEWKLEMGPIKSIGNDERVADVDQGLWNEVQEKVNVLQSLRSLIDEVDKQWDENLNGWLDFVSQEKVGREDVRQVIGGYEEVLRFLAEEVRQERGKLIFDNRHARKVFILLRREGQRRLDTFRYLLEHFAVAMVNVEQMDRVVVKLMKLTEESPGELVSFYAHTELRTHARGVMPVEKALEIAQVRLMNYWQQEVEKGINISEKFLSDGKIWEAGLVLEAYHRLPNQDMVILRLATHMQKRLDSQQRKVEAWQQSCEALEAMAIDPVKAYEIWQAIPKAYLADEKKERSLRDLRIRAREWIEPRLHRAREVKSLSGAATVKALLEMVRVLMHYDELLFGDYFSQYVELTEE
jgi:hypothetical protein